MVTSHLLPPFIKDVTGGEAVSRFQSRVQGSIFLIILYVPVALAEGPILILPGSFIHLCD